MDTVRTVKPSREIRQDVKIKGRESEVEGVAGAYRKEFWLESQRTLSPGETLYIQTRKPWPAHVTVCEKIGTKDDVNLYKFTFVPRDTTKRQAGEVKVSQSEKIEALQAEVADTNKRIADLMELIVKKMK